MLALLALAVLAPLLYLPGALVARALRGAPPPDPLERIYQHTALGALIAGWLAFTLGQLGIFSAWLYLLLLAAVCAAAALVHKTRTRYAHTAQGTGWVSGRTAPSLTLPFLLTLGIAFLLVARPFEVVIGVRDAGVYANAGFAMARTGALVQRDALVAQIAADQRSADAALAASAAQAETNFLGVQPRQRNIATRLRAAGFYINHGDLEEGRVTPQGLHLFTAWVGLLTALLGLQGGLLAPALMGLLGVWSVGMLARRLGGPWAGLLAALFLALNAAQVWFSRYSTTETTAQFLTFAGLYFFAALTNDQRPTTNDETPVGGVDGGRSSFVVRHKEFAALLSGLAFGQLALARIDFFLVLAPLALYLLYVAVARRWSRAHTWLAAGLSALLAHAATQFTGLARAYFFDTLFARLQDFAVTALIALPFLTPELRRTYLLRPCSPLTLQPCPPVAGMPPTTDAPWNVGRIALELAFLALLVLALLALHRSGQPLIRRAEAALGRAARPLLTLTAAATLLLGAYAYLVRPQILTGQTLTALPSCLAPAQLRQPEGPCLALQGYVGAPIAAPAYVDPLAAWLGGLPQRLRGQRPPDPAACVALRRELLPSEADGRTVPELIRDGLLDPAALDAATVERLRACDRLVLRAQFANSQANLVRVGWYTSPLGVALGLLGLALLWRRPPPGAWLFLVVALVAGVTFVRLTYGTSDQHYIYILRRYVPQVYPALAIGTAYALVALARLTNDQRPTTNDQHGSRDRSSFLVRRIRQSRERLRRVACGVLTLALTAFLVLTGLPIFRHTEYGGALGQIADAAGRFRPGDVVLLRGGAPTYAESRDLPDVIATPLTYAFGVDALTVKSREPERYAAQLARYLQEWQARGRQVYLALGASGGLAFPGLALEPAGTIALDLKEFEQLTDQKPRNVQDFQVSFTLYRVLPAAAAPPAPRALAPGDTAAQLRGLYRAETAGGAQVAWTNGDALLRLALPADASTLTVRLAGGRRPATLGPARACLSLHPNGAAGQVSAAAQPRCFTLGESLAEYTLPIEPGLAAESTLLLHIQSEPWIPARDDPQGRDPRRLGVQFGGVRLAP